MVRLDPLDEDMGQTPSQTEEVRERRRDREREIARDKERGKSDTPDPDNSGDIADEGPAHRG